LGTTWLDPLFFAITGLGGGGLLLAVRLGLEPARRGRAARALDGLLGAAALAAAVFGVAAWVRGQPASLWGSAGTFAALYLLLVVVPSPAFGRLAAAAARLAHSPIARPTGALALAAICPLLGLELAYRDGAPPDYLLSAELDAAMRAVAAIPHPNFAAVEPLPDTPFTTDRGRPVAIAQLPGAGSSPTPARLAQQALMLDQCNAHDRVIYVPTGWQDCNCHGFVFTGGRYAVEGSSVPWILADNDYAPVAHPRPGDLAVYGNGTCISHTGLVCGTTREGAILVESKWGGIGRFIHLHDKDHLYQSQICTFYRSPRPGHLLRGIYPDSSAVPVPLYDTPAHPPAPPAPEGLLGM
jgi:hypothetical protein